eukprot:7976624-Alexandrium_andersonii.AAC.1
MCIRDRHGQRGRPHVATCVGLGQRGAPVAHGTKPHYTSKTAKLSQTQPNHPCPRSSTRHNPVDCRTRTLRVARRLEGE